MRGFPRNAKFLWHGVQEYPIRYKYLYLERVSTLNRFTFLTLKIKHVSFVEKQ